MKIARIMMLAFALVMVVICFNSPAVFSADEHPWDEDGDGGNQGGLGGEVDTTKILDPYERIWGTGNGQNGGDGMEWTTSVMAKFLINIQSLLWNYEIPGLYNAAKNAGN